MHWIKYVLATLTSAVLNVILQLWLEQSGLVPQLMDAFA